MSDQEISAEVACETPVGQWGVDSVGLPVYRLGMDVPVATTTPDGMSYPLESDPYFLLGNDRLTLFAHASGRLLLLSGERGWVRVSGEGADAQRSVLTVTRAGGTVTHELVGLASLAASGTATRREFGCGFAKYTSMTDGVVIDRVLSVPPSTAPFSAPAAAVASITITNTGDEPAEITCTETVCYRPVVGRKRDQAGSLPISFSTRGGVMPGGCGVSSTATARAEDLGLLTGLEEPNRYNLYPPGLVLLPGGVDGSRATFSVAERGDEASDLSVSLSDLLAPGASVELVYVIGLIHPGDSMDEIVSFAQGVSSASTFDAHRSEWADSLERFAAVDDPVLRSELAWDGHALLAMATYSAYHRHTFIPQGMTYDYHMEMTAAPRDHLQHAMAAAYFAPRLARSTILYTLCKMTYQGEIKYMDFGNGDTSNSAWNTSDQQLYLFQALGEYLRITGDFGILDERTPYLPKEADFTGTTVEKIGRAFAYLRDEVAVGSHGLVRLMNSDWSDMVFVDLSVHRYFGGAESQMNSAMAMAVMPQLIDQLAAFSSEYGHDLGRLLASMRRYTEGVTDAMLRDMVGRTFARRVYLDAQTPLGDTSMDLEPQSFLLQADAFDVERKRVLWAEIERRLMSGEVLGPRQREKPVVGGLMYPGVSENGGFWYALAGQTVAGVATFDTEAALGLLDRLTMRNAARNYPDYWVGQWSGPDTVNAEFCGDLAGLPRPDNDGLWSIFPVYCAHVHAWPVYGYFRTFELA